MLRISYLMIGLLLLCAACDKPEKQTPNGLKYTVVKSGDGETVKPGEILVFDFELRDNKDSVWDNSYKSGFPRAFEIRDTSFLKGEDGIAQMLREVGPGDSVKTTIGTGDFFRKFVRNFPPPNIDTTGSLTYTVKAREIVTKDGFNAWREKIFTEREKTFSAREDKMIQKYLADKNIKAERDTSGIYYTIHNSTGGPKPAPGSCVEVKYQGKLLEDGMEFDKNDRIGFSLGEVITGWQLSIPMLAKGDSGTFYIPSKLAYGPRGFGGAIPPDAVLIFNVQLLNFGGEIDPATRTCK